jgi:hypothetical protein
VPELGVPASSEASPVLAVPPLSALPDPPAVPVAPEDVAIPDDAPVTADAPVPSFMPVPTEAPVLADAPVPTAAALPALPVAPTFAELGPPDVPPEQAASDTASPSKARGIKKNGRFIEAPLVRVNADVSRLPRDGYDPIAAHSS